jgi:hypothetical protein
VEKEKAEEMAMLAPRSNAYGFPDLNFRYLWPWIPMPPALSLLTKYDLTFFCFLFQIWTYS